MIQISDKFYDKTFKLFRYRNFESLCSNCGIFIEFDHFNDKELVDDGGTTYVADISFTDKRGYVVLIEFQSSIVDEDDISRFMKYAVLTYTLYKKPVEFYVISTKEKEDRVIRRKWNFFNEFTIYVKSLKSIDGDKVLSTLKKKKNDNKKFSYEDIVDIETLIFMNSNKTIVELLNEICPLINDNPLIDKEDLYDIKTFLLMYVDKFVIDEEEARTLRELIGMRNDLFSRSWASVRNDGIYLAESRIIKNMLDDGFDIEKICQIVEKDKSEVLEFIK